jgi:hypothetical protein
MTANEMSFEFKVGYDKITNFDAPGYEDEEISLLLNKAQERFFLQTYAATNKFKEGFEETEKRRKDLSELIANATISVASATQTGSLPNGTLYDLPTNFLYAIKEEVTISSEDECDNGKRIKVKPITHDEYTINIDNPFKQPDNELVWRLDYSRTVDNVNPKRHELITDGSYTISAYHLRYLRRLPNIVVDEAIPANQVNCILDEITHRRIVDLAIEIALEMSVDPRLQTNVGLNNKNE